MKTNKPMHTQGVWEVVTENRMPIVQTTISTELMPRKAICIGSSSVQDFYNAHRIVACVNACDGLVDPSVVPEMLSFLHKIKSKLVFDFTNSHPKFLHELNRILAKARGR